MRNKTAIKDNPVDCNKNIHGRTLPRKEKYFHENLKLTNETKRILDMAGKGADKPWNKAEEITPNEAKR